MSGPPLGSQSVFSDFTLTLDGSSMGLKVSRVVVTVFLEVNKGQLQASRFRVTMQLLLLLYYYYYYNIEIYRVTRNVTSDPYKPI
jgi:uncharacterized membrane protein (UPF0136 family)